MPDAVGRHAHSQRRPCHFPAGRLATPLASRRRSTPSPTWPARTRLLEGPANRVGARSPTEKPPPDRIVSQSYGSFRAWLRIPHLPAGTLRWRRHTATALMWSGTLITAEPCPRCKGIVIDEPLQDELLCINCGWRPRLVPSEVQREVDIHLGESSIERAHKHIPRGRPSMSWRERAQRRKERRSQAS